MCYFNRKRSKKEIALSVDSLEDAFTHDFDCRYSINLQSFQQCELHSLSFQLSWCRLIFVCFGLHVFNMEFSATIAATIHRAKNTSPARIVAATFSACGPYNNSHIPLFLGEQIVVTITVFLLLTGFILLPSGYLHSESNSDTSDAQRPASNDITVGVSNHLCWHEQIFSCGKCALHQLRYDVKYTELIFR